MSQDYEVERVAGILYLATEERGGEIEVPYSPDQLEKLGLPTFRWTVRDDFGSTSVGPDQDTLRRAVAFLLEGGHATGSTSSGMLHLRVHEVRSPEREAWGTPPWDEVYHPNLLPERMHCVIDAINALPIWDEEHSAAAA